MELPRFFPDLRFSAAPAGAADYRDMAAEDSAAIS